MVSGESSEAGGVGADGGVHGTDGGFQVDGVLSSVGTVGVDDGGIVAEDGEENPGECGFETGVGGIEVGP